MLRNVSAGHAPSDSTPSPQRIRPAGCTSDSVEVNVLFGAGQGGDLNQHSAVSTTTTAEARKRVSRLLLLAPACSLVLSVVLWLLLSAKLPEQIARHAGPDGVGYSPTWLVLAIMLAAAAAAFTIGAAVARGFIRDGHWYPIQKAVSVCILSLGYGILGMALGTVISTFGLSAENASGNSVAMGMFGFLALFAIGACVYTVRLPRAKQEPLGGQY